MKRLMTLLFLLLLAPGMALAAKAAPKAEITFDGLPWQCTLADVRERQGEGGAAAGRAGYPVSGWLKDSTESLFGYAAYTNNGFIWRMDFEKGEKSLYGGDVREIAFAFSKIPVNGALRETDYYLQNPEKTALVAVRLKYYTGFESKTDMRALISAVSKGLTEAYGRAGRTDKLNMGKIVSLSEWQGGEGSTLYFLSEASNRFCEITWASGRCDDLLLTPRDPAEDAEEDASTGDLQPRVRILGSGSVNVRASARQSAAKVTAVRTGTEAELLSVAANGWLEIRLPDGREGFVSPKMAEIVY